MIVDCGALPVRAPPARGEDGAARRGDLPRRAGVRLARHARAVAGRADARAGDLRAARAGHGGCAELQPAPEGRAARGAASTSWCCAWRAASTREEVESGEISVFVGSGFVITARQGVASDLSALASIDKPTLLVAAAESPSAFRRANEKTAASSQTRARRWSPEDTCSIRPIRPSWLRGRRSRRGDGESMKARLAGGGSQGGLAQASGGRQGEGERDPRAPRPRLHDPSRVLWLLRPCGPFRLALPRRFSSVGAAVGRQGRRCTSSLGWTEFDMRHALAMRDIRAFHLTFSRCPLGTSTRSPRRWANDARFGCGCGSRPASARRSRVSSIGASSRP
jgi:hypothetical protein